MRFTSRSLVKSALLAITAFPASAQAQGPPPAGYTPPGPATSQSLPPVIFQPPIQYAAPTPAAPLPAALPNTSPPLAAAPTPYFPKGESRPSGTPAFSAGWIDPAVVPTHPQIPTPPTVAPLGDISELGIPQWQAETEAMLSGPVPIDLNLRGQPTGWVGSLDAAVVQPYIASKITSDDLLDATFPGNPVRLPIGAMNFIAIPRVELGYRFADGLGEFRTAYQPIYAFGRRTIPDLTPGNTRSLRTRLQMHVVDFDYCFSEFNLGDLPRVSPLLPVLQIPGWLGLRRPDSLYQDSPLAMRFRLGVRTASMFLDAQATGNEILNERMMNNFAGAGIHFAVEATKAMPWRPLSMYQRLDFSGIVGDVDQSFERTDNLGNSAQATVMTADGAPVFGLEWGLQFVPPNTNFRASLAYQYSHWWQFADTGTSTAIFTTNGAVLSGQWGF